MQEDPGFEATLGFKFQASFDYIVIPCPPKKYIREEPYNILQRILKT
jgi:hypothetical protein